MQNIEAQMHLLLDEIAPGAHTTDEQAKIVAQATAIFNKFSSNKRLAKKANQRMIEAHMTDAILQAMGSLSNWAEYDESFVDGYGLSYSQIIQRVAQSSKPKWGSMEVLNPDLLTTFDFDYDASESELLLDDSEENHPPMGLKTKGRGTDRSDFQSQPIR